MAERFSPQGPVYAASVIGQPTTRAWAATTFTFSPKSVTYLEGLIEGDVARMTKWNGRALVVVCRIAIEGFELEVDERLTDRGAQFERKMKTMLEEIVSPRVKTQDPSLTDGFAAVLKSEIEARVGSKSQRLDVHAASQYVGEADLGGPAKRSATQLVTSLVSRVQ
jgi:hypothetical protein